MMVANALTMRLPTSAALVDDPDLPLIARIRQGDNHAFEELYGRYQRPIARTVYHMVRNADAVPDLVQEIFSKVYFALESFRPDMRFRPWLYRVAGNHCVDYLRRQKRQPAYVSTTAENAETGDWELADRQSGDTVTRLVSRDLAEKLLTSLKPRDRMLLVMKEVEELSLDEIAKATGMGIPAVKVALFRARKRVLERYRKWSRGGLRR